MGGCRLQRVVFLFEVFLCCCRGVVRCFGCFLRFKVVFLVVSYLQVDLRCAWAVSIFPKKMVEGFSLWSLVLQVVF